MGTREFHNREGKAMAEAYFKREVTKDELKVINEVNMRLDQFAHYPDHKRLMKHRKFLHHKEGIEYFGLTYGPLGVIVATAHVMSDTGWLPNMADYHTSGLLSEPAADNLGGRTGEARTGAVEFDKTTAQGGALRVQRRGVCLVCGEERPCKGDNAKHSPPTEDFCVLCGTSLYATYKCGHTDKERQEYKESNA